MVIYIALFALAVLLGIPLAGRKAAKAKKIIYLSVMFGLMYLVTVFRYGIGNDYLSYIRIFNEISSTGWSELLSLPYEPLYSVLTKLISMVTLNPEIMYAVYAVLILTPVAYAIYKHSDIVWISVTVYLCLTFFYASLSFIRQSIAASILLLAFGFIKQRKIIPVLILAVVASLFHYTALVFIPFYLLSYFLKTTKKTLIIYGSVSVGTLVICLIMKAAGANPMNLLANLATAVTGRDYNSYISSIWFEEGLGAGYLVMPAAVLALVLISYFLGWKEKEESDILLWFTIFNASIWSFIVYAFIVERFSMFVFIFSLFTIPSVLSFYSEKAEKAAADEKARKENSKKMPGYSSKKSEEKSDNAFLITVASVVGMLIYNCWGLIEGFHGVSPYTCGIPAVQDAIDGLETSEQNFAALYENADLYTYLVELSNTDNSYAIISTTADYDGLIEGIRRAADYAGTGLNRTSDSEKENPYYIEFNNRNGEIITDQAPSGTISVTSANGIVITNNCTNASITDTTGKTVSIEKEMLAFALFDENGAIVDATEFRIDQPRRSAQKTEIT